MWEQSFKVAKNEQKKFQFISLPLGFIGNMVAWPALVLAECANF